MSGEVTLRRRSVPDRLRYCAAQLGKTTPRPADVPTVAALMQILDDTAAELDQLLTLPALSDRELAVLERLAAGLSRQNIADVLRLPPGTVREDLRRVFTVLGVSTRTEAVAAAHRLGLLGVSR